MVIYIYIDLPQYHHNTPVTLIYIYMCIYLYIYIQIYLSIYIHIYLNKALVNIVNNRSPKSHRLYSKALAVGVLDHL